MISLLQETQEKDQKLTMLQLVDKMRIKSKELGWFLPFNLLFPYLHINDLNVMRPCMSLFRMLTLHFIFVRKKIKVMRKGT